MEWLKKLLQPKPKEQTRKQVAEETVSYVHGKKNAFAADMAKLQRQSKRTHVKALQTHEEAVKLNKMVEDITSRIAVATGGTHRSK